MDGALRPQAAASRLLRWLEEQDGPQGATATPVDRLRELLGLQVALFHPETRREGTYGWLEPGENLIFLRQDLSEPVRRFTLAHEIGHAVLHRAGGIEKLPGPLVAPSPDLFMPDSGPGCEGSDLDAPLAALAPGEEILRPGEAYSARAQRESEANAFAAILLLPQDRLLASYLARARQHGAFGGRRLGSITRSLAREFHVSEDVVLRSLTALLQSGMAPATEQEEVPTAELRYTGHPVELDPSQREASIVKAPALIVAGPGTGKTSTLAGRVAFLVEERGVPAESILALTFSNKAAREMRERLEALLRSLEVDAAPSWMPSPMPTVSTIHAFCGDLMRRYAPLVGLRPDFRLVSEAEGYFLLRQVAGELMLHHYQPLAAPGLHFPALLAAISRAKDELAGPERYAAVVESMLTGAASVEERLAAERASEVAVMYAGYQDLLRSRGDADFGDVIRLSVQLLCEQPQVLAEVRSRYQHVLVDEFQDINRAMGVLAQMLGGETASLWAVGDADQAIYRFRGASPANLAQFASDYPNARTLTLRRNYRSAPDILVAAAAVAGAMLGGERAPLEAARPDALTATGMAVTLASALDEQSELAGLAEKIKQRAETGRPFGDQVVLCRTRRNCERVAAALSAAGIPTRMTTPLLEQEEAKDMLAILSLLGEGSGSGLLRAGNIADHAFSAQDARSVLAAARAEHQAPLVILLQRLDIVWPLTPAGRQGLETLARIVAELGLASDVLTAVSRYIFSYTRIGQRLLSQLAEAHQEGRESGLVDSDFLDGASIGRVVQLLGLARAFEDQQRSQRDRAPLTSTSLPMPARHADWATFLEYVRVLLVLRQETAGFEEGPGQGSDSVRILTVHASKGLEFPIVYLPGLADRRFPMQRHGTSVPLLPGLSQDENTDLGDAAAHLAEEACLFYVALTRARDEVILSRAEQYGRMRYKASSFLAPIAAALGERLHREQWSPVRQAVRRPVVPGTRPSSSAPPERALQGPVRHSEIEMYQRCPRQYAYRYVYKLQPREIGLATLRHVLHAALHRLQQRYVGTRSGRRNAAAGAKEISLQEALNVFDHEWDKKLEQERLIQGERDEGGVERPSAAPSGVSGDAFLEVYRRHGRQVIERAWRSMTEYQARDRDHDGQPAPGVIFESRETHYDEQVTIQVRGRELSVVLDRVERGAEATAPAGTTMPVRLVRHRLGNSNNLGKPDLHALFYALAAEAQQGDTRPTELYSHNLTTGEVERVILDDRKLARLREELDTALEGIESGFYPPRPDPNICPSCPFLLICPA